MKYEISKGTLAVVPNGVKSSVVYEDEERYIVPENTFKIMEKSCEYFGSTYEGRKKGSKSILGVEYKVPIIIEDGNHIIVFPTTSPESKDCVWISLGRIKNIEKIDSYHTKVIFDNEKEIIVECSYRTMENQLSRAYRLDLILRKHKNSRI